MKIVVKLLMMVVLVAVVAVGMIQPAEAGSSKTNYKITVRTADILYAGTDSSVYIRIYGKNGTSTSLMLLDQVGDNDFERGDIDIFYLNDKPDVGEISHIMISKWYEGVGPDWYVHWVDVKHEKLNKTTHFLIDAWMDECHNGDVWVYPNQEPACG